VLVESREQTISGGSLTLTQLFAIAIGHQEKILLGKANGLVQERELGIFRGQRLLGHRKPSLEQLPRFFQV
jgi:hypothetical protein